MLTSILEKWLLLLANTACFILLLILFLVLFTLCNIVYCIARDFLVLLFVVLFIASIITRLFINFTYSKTSKILLPEENGPFQGQTKCSERPSFRTQNQKKK